MKKKIHDSIVSAWPFDTGRDNIVKNVMISMVKGITQCVRDQRTNYSVWFSSEKSGGEDEDEAPDIKSLAIKRPQIHELVSQHSCKLHCHVQMNSIADTQLSFQPLLYCRSQQEGMQRAWWACGNKNFWYISTWSKW